MTRWVPGVSVAVPETAAPPRGWGDPRRPLVVAARLVRELSSASEVASVGGLGAAPVHAKYVFTLDAGFRTRFVGKCKLSLSAS